MTHACRTIEALIDRRRSGLSESERLLLESHLHECAECARLSHEMYVVLAAFEALPQTLSRARRERVFAAAFDAAAREPRGKVVKRRFYGGLASLAIAAALALAFVPRMLRPAESTRVADALGAAHSSAPEPPSPAADAPWVTTASSETHSFAHAEVRLEARSIARFVPATHTLELSAGAVDVEVDPGPQQAFAVRTPRFTVDVLGTGFHVTMDGVDVRHGRVRIAASDGTVLVQELRAGQRWRTNDAASAPAASVVEPTASKHGRASRATQLTSSLARVRAALARGNSTDARQLLAEVEARPLRRTDRAEVATLRAECALVAGDLPSAARLYLEVNREFAGLPAGENALFAAAKLAARRADSSAERALLTRYLTRYPQGRFVAQARQALAP